jgi:predicted negative regulator of RcsB-dependent stress response
VRNLVRFLTPVAALALLAAAPAMAQLDGLTVPPSGDNQYSSATQGIGLVRVKIEYHSPQVKRPKGQDRRGKIWGALVPYGMTNLGFGTCGDQCPWRGGANENTLFTTSNDVKIEGKPLAAGSYGLHFIPGKDEWTVVFSNNHTSWGSFFYDPKEDALRVQVKPEKSDYHEWLTYEFTDRQTDRATLAMQWEDLQVPFTISVDNMADLYIDNMRRELRSSTGFSWMNWNQAAQYSLTAKASLPLGLQWAENAVKLPGIGQENFTTLMTLADLEEANGKTAEADKTRQQALQHPTANAIAIHLYGRQLLNQKKNEEAMKVFELNAKRYPNQWPVHVGLGRGNAALGHKKEALAEFRLALPQAPDEANRKGIEAMIKQLEEDKGSS